MHPPIGQRIIVIGSSNAGKTTLATRLSEQLSAPLIELDALHWEPGWVEADDDVFRERIRQAIAAGSWVMAGNYIAEQQHVSWPVADTVIWLDLSLSTILRRCIRRTWRRWRTAELLYGDNREIVWEHLMVWDSNKSLVGHIVKTHRSRRRTNAAFMRDPRWSHISFIRLRSVDEVAEWLGRVAEHTPIQGVTNEPVSASRDVSRA